MSVGLIFSGGVASKDSCLSQRLLSQVRASIFLCLKASRPTIKKFILQLEPMRLKTE